MACSNLSIYYQNCRGIRTKLNTLYLNILAHAYDVIVLTETWLTSDISDREFIDERYFVFRFDRNRVASKKKDGGGVLIAVLRELKPSGILLSPPLDLPEHVIVKIPSHSNKYHLLCATYIPPNTTEHIYINFLSALMSVFDHSHVDSIVLTGDFNLPQLHWIKKSSFMECAASTPYSNISRSLLSICSQLNLRQYNDIINCNGRILDLFYCNTHSITQTVHIPLLPIDTHHSPFYVQVQLVIPIPARFFKHKVQNPLNYYKADYEKINKDIDNVDWSSLLHALVPDEAVSKFYEKLFEIIRSHTPIRKHKNIIFPTWFTKALIRIYNNKKSAWIKWKKYGKLCDYELFSINRSKFKELADRCYRAYMKSVEDNIPTNSKTFWSYISNRKATSKIPGTIFYKQVSANDPTNACNLFSIFFHSVYEPSTFNIDLWEPPPPSTDHDINLCKLYISLDKVRNELKSLDATKGPGPDGIPAIFMKNTANTLCYPINIIFNMCLSQGTFPEVWKRANIVPVHKSGSKNDAEMYRPISILSTFSKLFEKVVFNEIYPFIRRTIINEQHGFVRDKSCISNLLVYTSQLFESIDNRLQVDAVYTDFQKAFDKVDHRLLLNKIAYNGIRGDLLRWFASYITNRTQKVVINGFESRSIQVTSGVPQGSILGPLLFILFINDIQCCFKSSKFLLYADDLKVFKIITNFHDCVEFQHDLDRLYNYCCANKLYLSLPKCHTITFSKKKKTVNFNYQLGSYNLGKVTCLRDLGVYLDSKLNLDTHVEKIVNKGYQMFGFVMRASRDFRRPATFLHLYKSIIRPQLEYAVSIWNPYYAKYKESIELVQRKYLRSMQYRLFRKRISYKHLLIKYDMLTLESRRMLLDTMTLFSVCRNKFDCPDLVKSLCYLVPRTVQGRAVRNRRLFATSLRKTNSGERIPLHRLVNSYNEHFSAIDILHLSKTRYKSSVIEILKDWQNVPQVIDSV